MTKETLDRIKNENRRVYSTIQELKIQYSEGKHESVRAYLSALRHVEFISELEKRILYCYITL